MSLLVSDPSESIISARCTRISARITVDGTKARISFFGPAPPARDLPLYAAIRLRLFHVYKANREKISRTRETVCAYFSVQHGNTVVGVQCFFASTSCLLFIYPSSAGLPELFRQRDEIKTARERQRVRELLERGLIRDDVFVLYYQPIIGIDRTGAMRAIKGAEAFLRVKDNGELHNPKKYLDLAEEDLNLMRKLGYKILELACSDLKWFKTKYPVFTLSLNVSEQQFARFDDTVSFESIFSSVKAQYEVERHDIALEVPETTADGNADSAAMLKRLFDDGTPIILDNFTMGALMKDSVVEIDKYKVSGKLLHDSCYGSDRQKRMAREFLQRVFGTARKYGKSVVVKGLESLEQIPVLFEQGFSADYDLLQGDAFCPPMDLRSFEIIYKENVTRLYRSHMLELFKFANVRVLSQKIEMLIDICAYFQRKKLTNSIAIGTSFSELWAMNDRNLVVILDYSFISHVVSPDQLKDAEHAEEIWEGLMRDGFLFDIPGLPMALIDDFQDKNNVAALFNMVEEYDGHNLYQILITINREKTQKIPFIILSESDTQMQLLEENVVILNNLDNLGKFEDTFVDSITEHPEAISKFSRF